MNFDKIPDHVFLKIFRHFPLEKKMKLRLVNKSFNRMAALSTAETSRINLRDVPPFPKITPNAFVAILRLCHRRLQDLTFPDVRNDALVKIFLQFSCHRLKELDLGKSVLNGPQFTALMERNPNLESITWQLRGSGATRFDRIGETREKLTTLKIDFNHDSFLDALIGRSPHLKRLEIFTFCIGTDDVLDEFLANSPKLETLFIRNVPSKHKFMTDGSSLWNLSNLRLLHVSGRWINDAMLRNISESFPQLEELHLVNNTTSSFGIGLLSRLQHLRALTMEENLGGDLDDGIRWLAGFGRLQTVYIDDTLSPMTLFKFVRACPDFRVLWVKNIDFVDSPESAALTIECLGIPKGRKQGKISLRICDLQALRQWSTNEVQAALARLKATHGHVFEVVQGYHYELDY